MEYEWQKWNGKQFASYMFDKRTEYNLSETKLGKILDIPQKNINRWGRGSYPSDEANVKKIWEYFHKLDEEKNKKERSEAEKKAEARIIAYDEDGEPIFMPDEDFDPYPDESIPDGCEKLRLFPPKAQMFIVENYYLIGAITQDEIEFIKCINQCSESERKGIVDYMESLKDNLNMYTSDDYGPYQFEAVEPQYNYFEKLRDYQWMVYNFSKYPTSWANSVNQNTKMMNEVYRKETAIKFASLNWEVAVAGGFFDGYDVINNANAIKNFRQEDWYYLFLYVKTILYDTYCEKIPEVNYKEKIVGWNMLKVWKMLEVALK